MLSYAAGKKKGHVNDHPILEQNPLKDVHLTKPSADERQKLAVREMELQRSRDLLPAETLQKIQHGLDLFDESKRAGRRNSRAHGKPHLADLDGVAYAHWFVPFAHIARLTGMRPGDVIKLHWQNIQTNIRARAQVLSFRPSKTKHHEKPIDVTFPIVGELQDVLNAWHNQQGKPKSGAVFPSRSGEVMNDKAYQRHWREVKKLAGLDANLDFYSFRHNFISDKVSRGWPLLRIAKLVGHKDASMIAAHYFHDDTDDLAELLAAIEAPQPQNGQEASA
jgi:integrase